MNGIVKRLVPAFGTVVVAALAVGCGSQEKKDRDFHTSGSREADQRAEQQVAKVQQLRGEGANKEGEKPSDLKPALYERLGGEKGIALIVEDWVNRAIADPRVNWERKGVTRGGWSVERGESVEWKNTPDAGTRMKKHIAQSLAVQTGGPPLYEGKDMKAAHAGMNISNAEFDAAIGDLKASMDNLKIPTQEQKELLAIVESARPLVVTKR